MYLLISLLGCGCFLLEEPVRLQASLGMWVLEASLGIWWVSFGGAFGGSWR